MLLSGAIVGCLKKAPLEGKRLSHASFVSLEENWVKFLSYRKVMGTVRTVHGPSSAKTTFLNCGKEFTDVRFVERALAWRFDRYENRRNPPEQSK